MNELIPDEFGTWIECCNPKCKKWRFCSDFDDNLAVPKLWYCEMNSDPLMNGCSIPECLELDENEVFVESKFKAGCIVWAKVIGHPWNIAMIEFCPDYKCYYWFDKEDSPVPSQYHVKFLARGRNQTRAWLKTTAIKSFIGNEDPTFALTARVRGRKISAKQRAVVVEGCQIARAAIRLTISARLKKYSIKSWEIVQRLENQLPKSRKQSRSLPANAEINVAGPSNAVGKTASNDKRQKKQSTFTVPSKYNGLQTDMPSTIETPPAASTNIVLDDSTDMDDTRSLNSSISKDISETWGIEGRFKVVNKNVVASKPVDDGPAPNGDSGEEIIPSSQSTSPVKVKLYPELSMSKNKNRVTESGEKIRSREKVSAGQVATRTSEDKENHRETSFYRRNIAEFQLEMQLKSSLRATTNYEQYQEKRRPLPRCLTDPLEMKKTQRKLMARLSTLSAETDDRMNREYREKSIREITGPAKERNNAKPKKQNYFAIAQKYDPEMMTSDED